MGRKIELLRLGQVALPLSTFSLSVCRIFFSHCSLLVLQTLLFAAVFPDTLVRVGGRSLTHRFISIHLCDIVLYLLESPDSPAAAIAFESRKKMAFSQNDLSQEVTSMTVDELREVLDDVVNHQKPKSEKCSLVRRLTEEASKDELSLEPHGHFLDSTTSGSNSRRKLRGSTAMFDDCSITWSYFWPSK